MALTEHHYTDRCRNNIPYSMAYQFMGMFFSSGQGHFGQGFEENSRGTYDNASEQCTKVNTSFKGRAGQGRAGQGRAGQGRAGQGRAGQGRAGQGRAGQGRAGQGRAGQGRAGQGRAGQGRAMFCHGFTNANGLNCSINACTCCI